jgi:allene oxide cyclase-like protein
MYVAPAQARDRGRDGDKDFRVIARITDIQKEDAGEKGASVGDKVTFKADLSQRRRDAGEGHGNCIVTEVNGRRDVKSLCTAVFELERGDLDLEGTVTSQEVRDGRFDLDVTGGSEDFDNASGDARFTRARHGFGGGDHRGRFRSNRDGDGRGDHGRGGRGGGDGHRNPVFVVDINLD